MEVLVHNANKSLNKQIILNSLNLRIDKGCM